MKIRKKKNTSRLEISQSVSKFQRKASDPFLTQRFSVGKTKGKGTFGKVKQGTHDPTGEKVNLVLIV